jgi:hypothetical protein
MNFQWEFIKQKDMHYINTRNKTWNIKFQLFENEYFFNLFKINALRNRLIINIYIAGRSWNLE